MTSFELFAWILGLIILYLLFQLGIFMLILVIVLLLIWYYFYGRNNKYYFNDARENYASLNQYATDNNPALTNSQYNSNNYMDASNLSYPSNSYDIINPDDSLYKLPLYDSIHQRYKSPNTTCDMNRCQVPAKYSSLCIANNSQ